jgi:hypothetical protein
MCARETVDVEMGGRAGLICTVVIAQVPKNWHISYHGSPDQDIALNQCEGRVKYNLPHAFRDANKVTKN